MPKKNTYIWISLLFIFIQILVTIRNYQETLLNFFWFCDFAPILLAIGFYFENTQFIKAVISVGLIPQLLYIFGFLGNLITGITFISTISEYGFFYSSISILVHAATLIALFLTYKEKTETKSLYYSLVIATGMYLVTLFFTSPKDEFNYVYSYTSLTQITIPYHVTFWIPLVFVFLILPIFFFQKTLFYLKK